MRTRRVYGCEETAVYHCVTRTVNGEFLFDDEEKEMMRRMLHRVVDFSGVELLTYAVMSNHVHVLVRVRDAAKAVSDEELLRRYRVLYPKPTKFQAADIRVIEQALKTDSARGQEIRKQLKARMGNVSEFMKTFKQRFTTWFNKSRGRYGTLWCERFKSTVVEDSVGVLRSVAAYVDLNPVRAGLVEDPKDYRFCGYAEALAGDSKLRSGLCSVAGIADASEALAMYRTIIFTKGADPKRDGSGAVVSDPAFHKVTGVDGALPLHQLLRQRVRFYSYGVVLGSELFVREHIRAWSEQIGDKRKREPDLVSKDGSVLLHAFRRIR